MFKTWDQTSYSILLLHYAAEGDNPEMEVLSLHPLEEIFDIGVLAVFFVPDGLRFPLSYEAEENISPFSKIKPISEELKDMVLLICGHSDNDEARVIRGLFLH